MKISEIIRSLLLLLAITIFLFQLARWLSLKP